jgi:hypothetical protein
MSRKSSTWQRVSKRRPCPVCDHPDWCLYVGPEDSPEAAICARVESPKRCGEAGYLHILCDGGPTWSPRIRRIEISAAQIGAGKSDFAKLAADFRAPVRPDALDKLVRALGVSAESLRRLGIGWSAGHRAWSFPMTNAAGNVLGIRLRRPDGRKLSVRGGHEGLFLPEGIDAHGLLLIAEGPTDTAALLDLGFSAVGRPSCTGGVKLLVELVRKLKPSGVVIVADSDAPGQRGAESLAAVLVAYAVTVRIITPPAGIKDARAWKQAGAMAADVLAAIDAAPVRRLAVRVER